MKINRNSLLVAFLIGLKLLIFEPCSAQLTTSKNFSVRIKQGTNGWVSVKVDSLLHQYEYNFNNTAEPQIAKFEADGVVTVEVTVNYPVTSFKVKPLKPIIAITQVGQTFTFVMNENTRQLCLELNGNKWKPLLIFKNPVYKNVPTASSPGVTYFGSGYTKIGGDGSIKPTGVGTPENPEIIFFDKDAIVEGHLVINKPNVIVKGTGILYNPKIVGSNYQIIMVSNTSNVRIEGITCVSRTDNWSFVTVASDHVNIDNLKLISEIRDGFDPLNSQDITIKHSFIMSHDDTFCPKGMAFGNNETVENILMDSCIVANMGGGNCLGVNGESVTPYYKNLICSNIDIIYSIGHSQSTSLLCSAITVHPSYVNGFSDPRYTSGSLPQVENVIFRNIRIESCDEECFIRVAPENGPGLGLRKVIFENISIEDSPSKPVKIIALDTNPIDIVSFSNLNILGIPINSAANLITANSNSVITLAKNVTFYSGVIPSIPKVGIEHGSDVLLLTGGQEQLKATVVPYFLEYEKVTWSSSNSSVASIDTNGLVTANELGTATITVTTQTGNLTGTVIVSVFGNNVARGKTVTVSGTNTTYIGSKAVDGDFVSNTSRWVSGSAGVGNATPQWIEINLGGTFTINGMRFWSGFNGYNGEPLGFKFQAWDGTGWQDAITETNNEKSVYNKTFPSITTSKVRLLLTDLSASGGLMRLYEIQVFEKILSTGYNSLNGASGNVKIYPNPLLKDNLSIQMDEFTSQNLQVSIFDITGRKIFQTSATTANLNNGILKIDRSIFEKGIYLLTVDYRKAKRQVSKLIVE